MEIAWAMLEIIKSDILISFSFYSVLFFSLKRKLTSYHLINEIDKTAIKITALSGLLVFLFWVGSFISEGISQQKMHTSPFWILNWIQQFVWLLPTQILWIKRFQNSLTIRILISLFYILTFERLVIIITSLHRDYLPNSFEYFTFDIPWYEILIGISTKVIIYILFVSIIHLTKEKLKTYANKELC